MPIYVVIPSQESLDEEVRAIVPQEESYQMESGVWFVRSDHRTCSELESALGIEVEGKGGIVVAPSRYTGAADIALAEKLAVWEGRK